ncbi:MAG: Gfo/Idh/MocA family protein [Acidimicrobiia bacterium]
MTAVSGICVVGTGAIAADHMIALDSIGVEDRPWVVSRRAEAAADFAGVWGFERWSTRPEEAFGDPRVSLVIIASPNTVHSEQASMALRAGKDVVLEIPASLTLADVEDLQKLSKETHRQLFVCHTMRSFPAIREVKRRVETGELEVSQILGFFAVPRRQNQGWVGPRSWADDILWHHACHQIDSSLWVLGAENALRLTLHKGRSHDDLPMVMDLSLGFSCGDDVVVSHGLTYNSDRLLWELRFIGRRDSVIFRNGALLDEEGREIVPQHSIRDLEAQDAEILRALVTGDPCSFDIDNVMPAYRLLDVLASIPER